MILPSKDSSEVSKRINSTLSANSDSGTFLWFLTISAKGIVKKESVSSAGFFSVIPFSPDASRLSDGLSFDPDWQLQARNTRNIDIGVKK